MIDNMIKREVFHPTLGNGTHYLSIEMRCITNKEMILLQSWTEWHDAGQKIAPTVIAMPASQWKDFKQLVGRV